MDTTKKNSLLIVDDDAANIAALARILDADYVIYAAKNGKEALEVAMTRLPDVILLDILMPDMNGYEVIAALKHSDRTREIPIIFVTGVDNEEAEEKSLQLGAADYIRKPFSAAIVKLRVRNQIKMRNYIQAIEALNLMDQLTGIPNRRAFNERLRTEWARAIRFKKPISLLILDLDNFKKYNDTYGHMQGDVALHAAAAAFSRIIRRSVDCLARWGGEEFIVLLPNTDWNGALEVAEQMRVSMEDTVIPLTGGGTTKITVSIGVNAYTPRPSDIVDVFIHQADKALYAAKNTGRNRVCRAEAENDHAGPAGS